MSYNNYPSPYPAIPAGGIPYPQMQPQLYPQQTPVFQQPAPVYQQMPTVPPPLMQQAPQPQQSNMILDWVQGPEAASAYYVAPGRGAILMDINRKTFYLTSRGEDNIPRPLQTFDYYQRPQQETVQQNDQNNYADKTDYGNIDRRLRAIEESIMAMRSPVQTQMLSSGPQEQQNVQGQPDNTRLMQTEVKK